MASDLAAEGASGCCPDAGKAQMSAMIANQTRKEKAHIAGVPGRTAFLQPKGSEIALRLILRMNFNFIITLQGKVRTELCTCCHSPIVTFIAFPTN